MSSTQKDRDPAEVTSYFGRTAEIAANPGAVADTAAGDAVGPGGVGKTRLCGQVLPQARRRFADGAVFVELAELRAAHLLGNAITYQLGLADQSTRTPARSVLDHLWDKEFLLVLDNCEHLVTAVASLLHDLLRECPRLVVLTTSRQSLGLDGEHLLHVPPLAVPDDAAAPPDVLTRYGCSWTGKLEGLPLAIELAVVRVRSLSLRQIADRLDSRSSLL